MVCIASEHFFIHAVVVLLPFVNLCLLVPIVETAAEY